MPAEYQSPLGRDDEFWQRSERRIRRIIRNLKENIAACEWWARHRTEHEPADCEPERVALPIAQKCLSAIQRRDMPTLTAENERLLAYMVKEFGKE